MAGGGASKTGANLPKAKNRKRVEAEEASSLKRARDGSAFTRCEKCNKNVAVALIGWHDCLLEAQIEKSLDAQAAELERQVEAKAPERKKAQSAEPRPKKGKKEKKSKDPNAPKRPPTAFFIFMEEFRKSYKEANPDNKSVSVVAKEGGEKWKSLTDQEKKRYVDRAAELKAEYEKALKADKDPANAEADEEGGSSEKEVKVETMSDGE